ncbi:MAG: restriction endonuclease subunit M, partial [Verrucomicrobia bacterium]|nr:restriction endonuclease subunit M [Verrucomicrobiota bacterium]
MPIPAAIQELVERFKANHDAYRSAAYNEEQCRAEFINPFFLALGWDIENKAGWSETYKDVLHEEAIKMGEATKAPDYCFRVGGARKFFVEAKRPSVDLKDDIAPAYQLRRYAWTTKLPLSVLTDFEEFAVYDCRVRPFPTDKPSTGRVLYLGFEEYPQRWDDIAAIFSKDAVLKGRLDKFAESNKVKKGTADVDDEFLREIENWRDLLARNLALRNPALTQRELNFAVTRIIDRIVFLRICEGRGIEHYGRLQSLLNGAQIYPRLCELFQRADERYNSGLFHFTTEKERPEAPDALTLSLALDDKPLKEIIENLYYPKSPYAFSALPAEVLGQVYEQFLGKVIRLTEGHQAKVEEKPEVKKAGGVYYTPAYIVDYIVKNTVGKLLGQSRTGILPVQSSSEATGKMPVLPSGLTPKKAAKLRILDPACGSGSFLIGA